MPASGPSGPITTLSDGRYLYVQDTNNGGAWYDFSTYVDILQEKETPRADNQVQQYSFVAYSFNPATKLPAPVQLVGGMEVLRFDVQAGVFSYKFAGRIMSLVQKPMSAGYTNEVGCEGFERDLNAHVSYISFDATTYRYDKDRVTALVETPNLVRGTWDAHTYVYGPFVDYLGTGAAGYYRTTVWDILTLLATTTPNLGTNVTNRRWYVTGKWSDESNPGTGNVVRVLHYYEGLTGAQEVYPLTDRNDKTVVLANATFSGLDNATQLPQAETGQYWETQLGTWGVQSGHAYAPVIPTADTVAVIDSGRSNGDVYLTFTTQQTTARILFRVITNAVWSYRWEGLFVQNGGSDYSLWKYQSGAFSLLGTASVTPANGDILHVNLAGAVITLFVNGTQRLQVTNVFNQSATKHGMGVQAIGAARFDNFQVTGLGVQYYDWERDLDYTAMFNTMAIQGPGADLMQPDWQNLVRASGGAGKVTKTDVDDWQATHTYSVGDRVKPVANPNGKHYRATTTGTTSGTEPAVWPTTEGATQLDGTVTWMCETWDAGGASQPSFTDDGGYITTRIEQNTVVSDQFGRPDGTLGNTETGQSWTVLNGTFALNTGQAYCSNNTGGWAVVDAGIGSSAIVQAKVAVAATDWRLAFRVKDTANAYFVRILGGGGGTDVVRRQGGVDTTVLHVANNLVSGNTVRVVIADDLIQLYINGVFIAQSTGNTFLMGATKHGISVGASGYSTARWDDFAVWQSYTSKVWGIGPNTACSTQAGVAYGIYFDGPNRTAQAMESGVLKGSSQTGTLNDAFKIEARRNGANIDVTYWRQAGGSGPWVLFYTSLSHPSISIATPYYINVALYHTGAAITSATMRRFTYGVYQDPVSFGRYGVLWANKMVQDDTLDTDAKRSAYANGMFARYGYPRDGFKALTTETHERGSRSLLNNTRLGLDSQLRVIAEVEATRTSSQKQVWRVVLGDSPYEYGDDEPLGVLLRAPDRDTTEPPTPDGFAPTIGLRQNNTLVTQRFAWLRPVGDAEFMEITVWPTGLPGRNTTRRFGADARTGDFPDLDPGTHYTATGLFRDFNGHPSHPTQPIEFTSLAIAQPDTPSFGVPAFPAQGPEGDWGYWAQINVVGVSEQNRPAFYHAHTQRGSGPTYFASVPATQSPLVITFRHMDTGTWPVTLYTEDVFGMWSAPSAPQNMIIGAAPALDLRRGGSFNTYIPGETTEVPRWALESAPPNTTLTLDGSVVLRGLYSMKLVLPPGSAGQSVSLVNDPLPVVRGHQYSTYWGVYPSGAAAHTVNYQVRQYDKANALVGPIMSILQLTTPTNTVWTESYPNPTLARSSAAGDPGDAVYMKRVITVTDTTGAGGTWYFTYPVLWDSVLATDTAFDVGATGGLRLYGTFGGSPWQPIGSLSYDGTNNILTFDANNTTSSNTAARVRGRRVLLAANSAEANVNIGAARTADPGSPTDGDAWVWTDSSVRILRFRDSSTTVEVASSRIRAASGSWPTAPTGTLVFRTDLGRIGMYDGTRWVSDLFAFPMHNYQGTPPYAAATEALAGGITGQYAKLVKRFAVSFYVGGTNNGTNYWQFILRRLTSSTVIDNLATLSTSASAANSWLKLETTTFSNNPLNTSDVWLQLYLNPVGSPSAVYVQVGVDIVEVLG